MNLLPLLTKQNIFDLLIPLTTLLAVFLAGVLLRKFLFQYLSKLARNSKTGIDDFMVSSTKGPFLIWCLMLGIYFALEISKAPAGLTFIAGKTLLVLGIISMTMVLAKIAAKFINIYSQQKGTAMPVTSLSQNVSRIIIFGLGILVILNSLGISITPILATLGVGGLAVALALQDTLSNLFAGFYIIASRQVRIGDYIKLDTGEEGYVADINWRITKIRMLPNNMVLVPNEKLTKSIIVNFYLPDKEMAVLVNLGVHYRQDLKKVEKITCDVGKEIMKEVAGGVSGFEPFIRYHTFGDSSINFTVILRAKEFVDQYLIKHEFVKRLQERYNKEGIVIPFPIRAINYEQEKANL
ncbi:MAG: mechanosensitive ion channel family protein [Elusimicrobiota bacterium]